MKYDLAFKRQVIAYYKEGYSVIATAQHFGISNESTVRLWIAQYDTHGLDALKPRTNKTRYSAEFKLNVISTAKDLQLSLREAANRFAISSPSLIYQWRKAYEGHGMLGLQEKPKGRRAMMNKSKNPYIVDKPDDEKTPAELKRELEYLRAENEYLKKLDALLKKKEKKKK